MHSVFYIQSRRRQHCPILSTNSHSLQIFTFVLPVSAQLGINGISSEHSLLQYLIIIFYVKSKRYIYTGGIRPSNLSVMRQTLVVVCDEQDKSCSFVFMNKLSFVYKLFPVLSKSTIDPGIALSLPSSLLVSSKASLSTSFKHSALPTDDSLLFHSLKLVIPSGLSHQQIIQYIEALSYCIVNHVWYGYQYFTHKWLL